jgi:tetratricopeptide (TPR) repeat protein
VQTKYFLRAALFLFFLGAITFNCQAKIKTKVAGFQQPKGDSLSTTLNSKLKLVNNTIDSSLVLADSILDDVLLVSREQNLREIETKAVLYKSWIALLGTKYYEAIRLAHKAKMMSEKSPMDSVLLASSINMLGLSHMEFKRFDVAVKYFEQCIDLLKRLKNVSSMRLAITYNNLGALKAQLHKPKEAIQYFKEARVLHAIDKDTIKLAYRDMSIGKQFAKLNESDSAIFYTNRSLNLFNQVFKEKDLPDVVSIALGEHYLYVGKYDKSVEFFQKGLNKSVKNKSTDRWKEGYDLLAQAHMASGDYEKASVAYRRRIEITDSVNAINNAKEIASIEEQYRKAEMESELNQIKAQNLERENEVARISLKATIIISSLSIIMICLVFLFWLSNQKRKTNLAKQQAALSSTKLFAMRSQMNSHFVFNSINTALGFISNSQKHKAHEYLSRFAKILRTTLEEAGSEFVLVENEVELIKDYIEIESIRFGGKFRYSIEVSSALESEVYEMPSMILQPFVENAIIHGLVNLTDRQGSLKIVFKKISDEKISCMVEDNGVGREKAMEIKTKKAKYYSSQALTNVRQRLKLLNQSTFKSNAVRFQIIDLKDDAGKALGTRVIVDLPLY